MGYETTISSGSNLEGIIAVETLNLIEEAASWHPDSGKSEDLLKEFYDYVCGAVDLSVKLIRKLKPIEKESEE